ncbi:MAG: GtrA family protein, partial [Pseudonocardia sp.]
APNGRRPVRIAGRDLPPTLAQIVRYVLVGGASTLLNAVLFYVLRAWWDPVPASAVSLVLSTAYSTEAHRRYTFGVVGERVRSWRVHLQSVGTVVFYAWYGVAVLAMLHLVVAAPTRLQETASIAAASVLGGITRFLLLRSWVFTPRSAAAGRIPGTPEVPATPALAGDGR